MRTEFVMSLNRSTSLCLGSILRLAHNEVNRGMRRIVPVDTTGDLLMAAARALRRRYGTALARWDITPGQARALRIVAAAEEAPRLSEIADRLRIVPRSATEVIDALEQRDLVVRRPDPADRRATCVVATAEGERLATVIEEARAAEGRDYLSVLPAADRAELRRILEKLVAED